MEIPVSSTISPQDNINEKKTNPLKCIIKFIAKSNRFGLNTRFILPLKVDQRKHYGYIIII